MSNPFLNLPSVNELLDSPPLRRAVDRLSRNVVVTGVREFLDRLRTEMPPPGELAERIARWLDVQDHSLRPVVNATGVLVSPRWGRAPLADEAVQALAGVAGYCRFEPAETDSEADAAAAVSRPLQELTGAEAAFVVNNNAAAVWLALSALGHGREVVVARSQQIETDGWRLPDAIAASGARVRDVGTITRTRREDIEAALGPQTAMLLGVHVPAAAERDGLATLVSLGRKHGVPVVFDAGWGALTDFAPYGLKDEPLVRECLQTGADLVLFSGDKLVGGPQCGVIVGRRSLVERLQKHPLARALRIDKLTLAGLEATLRLYRALDVAERSVPLLSLLSTPLDNLKNRAERLAPQLRASPLLTSAEAQPCRAALTDDAPPSRTVASWGVALRPAKGSASDLAATLARAARPVLGRVESDTLLLDLRTVFPRDDELLGAPLEPA